MHETGEYVPRVAVRGRRAIRYVGSNTGVGNMQLVENPLDDSVFPFTVAFNRVAGNLRVSKNGLAGQGVKGVARNSVGGNLQCFDNAQPFFAQLNTVTGSTEGQCAQA
jgi:hypothetical protein